MLWGPEWCKISIQALSDPFGFCSPQGHGRGRLLRVLGGSPLRLEGLPGLKFRSVAY